MPTPSSTFQRSVTRRFTTVLLLVALLAPLLLIAVEAGPVNAHAVLVRTDPAANTVLSAPPAQIHLWFTEPLDPSRSTCNVHRSAGLPVQGVASRPGDGADDLVLDLPSALPLGLYAVSCRTVSVVDGHTSHSGYLAFTIGTEAEARAAAPLPIEPMGPQGPILWLATILRLAALLGLATSVAIWPLWLVVLRPAISPAWQAGPGLVRRTRRLAAGAWLLAVLANLVAFLLYASTTGTVSLDQVLTAVISGTGGGALLRLQLALFLVYGGTLLLCGWWWPHRRRVAAAATLVLAAALPLPFKLVMDASGYRVSPLALTTEWPLLLGVSVWIGGLVVLGGALVPTLGDLSPAGRRVVLARVLPRFSVVALGAWTVIGLAWLISGQSLTNPSSGLPQTPGTAVRSSVHTHQLPVAAPDAVGGQAFTVDVNLLMMLLALSAFAVVVASWRYRRGIGRMGAHAAGQQPFAANVPPSAEHVPDEKGVVSTPVLVFDVSGMDCGHCAQSVQNVVASLPGVASASVNFAAGTLTVAPATPGLAGLSDLVGSAVARAGYRVRQRLTDAKQLPARPPWWREPRFVMTAAGALCWALGFALSLRDTSSPAVTLLYGLAIVLGGWAPARAGVQALRAGRLDMNVLTVISAVGAAALGEWSEGGMVVVLFALGGVLQTATIDRTRGAIRALMQLAPPEAVVVRGGEATVLPARSLVIGDLVLVKPGGRVPADGRVVDGWSSVDQSTITGESLPVDRAVGDEVFAGTINGPGALTIEVTRPAADSVLARIIHLVEEAQESRSQVQVLVDRLAAVYTPTVIAGALFLATIGLIGAGDPSLWVYRALVLLVIACPCSIIISTPVSIVAAIGAAMQRGVLIKGGAALEAAGRVRVVVFDKTGTLTRGRPSIADIVPLVDLGQDEVLELAAAVEALSEHPLGRAVVEEAQHRALVLSTASDFQALPGRGAEATVGAVRVTVGNARLMSERGALGRAKSRDAKRHVRQVLDRFANGGWTPLLVSIADTREGSPPRLIGAIAVFDAPRPEAAAAIRELRRIGVERIIVLTGDTRATGAAISTAVGADEVRAELLPAEKATAVHEIRRQYGPVAVVGDGVNDAPALATADIGIAMGAGGSDAALEAAELALMGDDLGGVAYALTLSRRTTRVIRQNIGVSLVIKIAALALGAVGVIDLWVAVVADVGTSLAVTGNGLRLGYGGLDSPAIGDEKIRVGLGRRVVDRPTIFRRARAT